MSLPIQSTTPLADGQLVTDVLALYASQGRIRDALTLAKFAQERKLLRDRRVRNLC